MECDEAIRAAEERRQSALTQHIKAAYERRVLHAAMLLLSEVERVTSNQEVIAPELARTRSLCAADEAEAMALIEAQRKDAESRYQANLLAGLDEEKKVAIKELIKRSYTSLRAQQALEPIKPKEKNAKSESIAVADVASILPHLRSLVGGSSASNTARFESLSGALSSVISLSTLPSSSWASVIESGTRSASQMLSSQREAERRHLFASIAAQRPQNVSDEEETMLQEGEKALKAAKEAEFKAQQRVVSALTLEHNRLISGMCHKLDEADKRAGNLRARLSQQLTALDEARAAQEALEEQEAPQASNKRLQFQKELAELEAKSVRDRKSHERDLIDQQGKYASKLQSALLQNDARHVKSVQQALHALSEAHATIAQRKRALAAVADNEEPEAIERALLGIESGSFGAADSEQEDSLQQQEKAMREFHASALAQLLQDNRDAERLLSAEQESERHAALSALRTSHEQELQSLRQESERALEALRSESAESATLPALELELRNKAAASERTMLAAHRDASSEAERVLSRTAEAALQEMQREHADTVRRESDDAQAELEALRSDARAQKEHALLEAYLRADNRDRAKPLIEAALQVRQQLERAALLERQRQEAAQQALDRHAAALRERQNALEKLERAGMEGRLSDEEMARQRAELEEMHSPERAAAALEAALFPQHDAALRELAATQQRHVRDTMLRFYPDETFTGSEWQTVDAAALEAVIQQKQADLLKAQSDEQNAQRERLRADSEREVRVAQLLALTSAR